MIQPKTLTATLIATTILIALIAMTLLVVKPAKAGDDHYRTHSRATDRRHCTGFGIEAACSYRAPRRIRRLQREARWERYHGYREERHHHHRHVKHTRKVHRDGGRDWSRGKDGGFCSDEVSAVGTEHYGEEDAKKAAVKAWMAEVRHRRGTEFMDIGSAQDVAFRCVVSTPGDRVSDKIAIWTRGDLLKECRVIATPCKPEMEEGLPKGLARDR